MAPLEDQIRSDLARSEFAAAASTAIRGYGPEILGYLTSVLRDRDDADDAFGRFAEDLWESIARFRAECSMKAWCYKLAWHAAADVLREPYRRRRRSIGTSEASRLAASVRATPPAHLRSASREWIERARSSLTPAEHTLIILRFDRGLSWREVSEVLAGDGEPVDEAALRKRYERLKGKLRKLAEDEGLLGK